MEPSVVVLGAGTLGEIVIGALLKAGWRSSSVSAIEKRAEHAASLAAKHGIPVSGDPAEVLADRQVLVIAVKPNDVDALLGSIRPLVRSDHIVLSLCAGVPTHRFENALGDVPVIRAMPNTPAAVSAAMTAYARGTNAEDRHVRQCHQILTAFGDAVEVDEELLDAVTAVSGSGPAYVFLLAEAMERAGVELGLPEDVAKRLVQQTIRGSGALLSSSPQTAEELRIAVTSPGGTTAAALEQFEKGGFTDLVLGALQAAAARSRELGAG